MKVRLWGTRGSLASAGPETVRYGGNTSCVEVRDANGGLLVLDAGTGIRRLGTTITASDRRIDLLLTHLHMDHIQGLGFFQPLFRAESEVHIWGPPSTTHDLRARLTRYLSPPLFPVRLHDLESHVSLHDAPLEPFIIGRLTVQAAPVIHPGPTLGYRISDGTRSMAYLPDHEPALGGRDFADRPEWVSGRALAADADLLIHDAQYTADEYADRIGWGHSAVADAVTFAALAGVRQLVAFHHDPDHDDRFLDALIGAARSKADGMEIHAGSEGDRFDV